MKKEKVIDVFPSIDLRKFSFRSDGDDPIVNNSRFYNYASGRSAIYHGISCLGMPMDSIVLMPIYHCGVEIEAVIRAGYKVEFYRLNNDLTIDLEDIQSKLRPEIKALFIIHYYGFPQPITKIKSFCNDFNLYLVEDCSHAMYSQFRDKWLGSFGDIGVYSQRKVFGQTNGGGLVINNDSSTPSAGDRHLDFKMLKSTLGAVLKFETSKDGLIGISIGHFISKYKRYIDSRTPYNIDTESDNPRSYYHDSRYDYKHAISSLSLYFQKKTNYQDIVKRRRGNYECLDRLIKEVPSFQPVFKRLDEGVCPLCYPVFHEERDKIIPKLNKKRILTYAFGKYSHPSMKTEHHPESSYFRDHIVGLPIQQQLKIEDIEFVVDTLHEISS